MALFGVKEPDPSQGQTEISIGAFLASRAVGDEIAIRNPHGGHLSFVLTTISEVGTGTRSRYIYTKHSGDYGGTAWNRKNGRNARSPGGQTHLVEATAEVRDFIKKFPLGTGGYYSQLPVR